MKQRAGTISVRMAMSLDGFIADEGGRYDWIVPVASPALDTDHQLPFGEFLDAVDVVVMGRHCYDQGQHRDYASLGKRVIVATSAPPDTVVGEECVRFAGSDIVDVVVGERAAGSRCFLFGGGVLVTSFLAAEVVDELTIGIVPVLLGRGRRLFVADRPALELTLTDYAVSDGKVRLVYRRRQLGSPNDYTLKRNSTTSPSAIG